MQKYRRDRNAYPIQIPLTSLIDIVFLLLIFFLLSANFLGREGIKINLPQSQDATVVSEEGVSVYIDAKGRLFWKDTLVAPEQLLEKLRAALAEKNERLVIIIKAERSIAIAEVVRVMDIVRAAGAEKLLLATTKEGKR